MAATTTKSKTKQTGRFSPEQVKQFLEQGSIQTMDDVQSALKDLFSQTLQAMLEGEMEHHLGYAKHERLASSERLIPNDMEARPERASSNRRNGHTGKNVRSDYGDIALSVPRDREGSYEPLIVHKRQKNVTGIEDQILALYAMKRQPASKLQRGELP
jgi:putative transposase